MVLGSAHQRISAVQDCNQCVDMLVLTRSQVIVESEGQATAHSAVGSYRRSLLSSRAGAAAGSAAASVQPMLRHLAPYRRLLQSSSSNSASNVIDRISNKVSPKARKVRANADVADSGNLSCWVSYFTCNIRHGQSWPHNQTCSLVFAQWVKIAIIIFIVLICLSVSASPMLVYTPYTGRQCLLVVVCLPVLSNKCKASAESSRTGYADPQLPHLHHPVHLLALLLRCSGLQVGLSSSACSFCKAAKGRLARLPVPEHWGELVSLRRCCARQLSSAAIFGCRSVFSAGTNGTPLL